MASNKIHTCDLRVWTEIKRAIIVSGWAGTVRLDVLGNFGEVEVIHHGVRDCAVIQLE